MSPYVDDQDFTLYVGDVREVLDGLPAESVHCCVTSPPYWGLRDYGTVGQLGLEPTPEEYVANMVAVFREVRRVLRRDGTCWLNLGDSFSHGGNGSRDPEKWPKQSRNDHRIQHAKAAGGTRPKDMVGIPWRVAFALQADGWYLRSDIIWSKPAPMPESVTDRPTKAHEYVFLLTKSARYYYDATAIAETSVDPESLNGRNSRNFDSATESDPDGMFRYRKGFSAIEAGRTYPTRNKRTVWTINTEPFTGWGSVVRQRPVAADAPDGGKKRTTSPDCPVHGDHPAPVATAADGGRADGSSIRTERTDVGHVQAPLAEFVPTGPRLEPDSALGSSGSPVPAGSPTATARNRGTHRTASRSSSRGTACAETSCRTGDTSPSSESLAPDGSGSRDSFGTPDHTGCTCAWYVEYTDKTSHFATFPQALVEPCILAGTSERGCCPVCGAPWERETERTADGQIPGGINRHHFNDVSRGTLSEVARYQTETTGWRPTCEHEHEPVACVVLDPFSGSGTTALVSRRHGRRSIGIELNAEYAKLAAARLQQLSLLAEPA